jgi:serine phosphatase RsbU (regulator of sigma subunit)/DNA-binding NarL/FixJ family response regulator
MTAERGRILLVEDTESSRYILGSWLRRAGFRVLEAATGTEALKLAGPDIDLVVLDVHLPDMSGLDVCRIIKAAPETASVPVLHVSATAVAVSDRTTGLTSGADGYLVEPVEPEELVATITALLRYSAARRSAERLARQLGALTSTTLRINGANTLGDLLAAAAEGAAEMFTSDVMIISAPDNGPAVCARASPLAGPSDANPISPLIAGSLVGAAATALGEKLPGGAESAIVGRDVLRSAATGDDSLPGSTESPLLVTLLQARSGAPIGAVFVAVRLTAQQRAEPRPVDEGDALLVRQLGQSVGVALENLRLFREEHRIALTLQRSLLPERLPTVPGLAFAARYNASSELASVGGDFYDAFVLPNGWVLVAIGDVQGHSLHAATTMAELRYSLRAYAMEGHQPDVVLQRLNDLLMRGHPEETATACLLSVSPDLSTLTYANAGHLPPLLISGGQASFLEGTGVLLGVAEHPPAVLSITLPSDALIVLVTDGLIERRDDDLDNGLRRLAEAALAGGQELEPLCDSLLARLAEGTVDDDTALLVMRRVQGDDPSELGSEDGER